jgi:hypothetical protein
MTEGASYVHAVASSQYGEDDTDSMKRGAITTSELVNRRVFWLSSTIFAVIAAWLQHGHSHNWTIAIVGGVFLIVSLATGAMDLLRQRRRTRTSDVSSPASSQRWPTPRETGGDSF